MRIFASKSDSDRSTSGTRGIGTWKAALTLLLIAVGSFVVWFYGASAGRAIGEKVPLHFTVNHRAEFPKAAAVGFNLADVSSVDALDALPEGAMGVLWVGNGYNQTCSWQVEDEKIVAAAQAARGHPKFSGIYFISDTPHPSVCPDAPERIAERTALIHENDPDGRTFIAVSGGFKFQEEFAQLAKSADLFGIVVFPCNTAKPKCELNNVVAAVNRALDAGIPIEQLVPVFQAFGQDCSSTETKWYRLPTDDELTELLAVWDELLPPQTRPFDMTYSWGEQEKHACPSLITADGTDYPNLQKLYAKYFASMK